MAKEDVSMVSSRGSYTPTDLSRRTGHTSVSVPADGRAITIHTNRRKANEDAASQLTAASQTSLLIEYFESGKRSDGVPSSRPSVRVKLTPSSKNRSQGRSRETTELGARETSPKARRNSYTNRQSLSVPKAEDRLTLGEDRVESGKYNRRSSFSGDLSSNLSLEDDEDGRYEPDSTIRIKKGRSNSKSHRDTLSPRTAKKAGRSRSTSREYDDLAKPKSGKGRSRSKSADRISKGIKEKMEKLGADVSSKTKKGDDNLKAPRRRRSRSASRDRSGKKGVQKLSDHPQYNPALLEAVEDTIKRLILPQLQDLKFHQNKSKFDSVAAAISKLPQNSLSVAEDPRGLKSASMPDVSKADVNKPMVVLQPDFDKGKGQGFVVAGSQNSSRGSDASSKALGLGPTMTAQGDSVHSAHSDKGEGVLLEPLPDVAPGGRVKMPPMPLDYPESNYAETRASILTDNEAPPYPYAGRGSGMPGGELSPSSSLSSFQESIGGRQVFREPESALAPSTLYPDDLDYDRPGSSSSIDSGSRVSVRSIQHVHVTPAVAKPIVVTSPSQLSIPSISDTPSAKIARQRRKGKARDRSIGEEDEDDDKEYAQSDLLNSELAPPAKTSGDWNAFEQRELAQQQASQNPNLQRAAIEARHMSTNNERSFEDMHSEQTLHPAICGSSAVPEYDNPLPEVHGMLPDYDDVTNPSIMDGAIGHRDHHDWDDEDDHHQASGHVKDEGYASPGFSSPGPTAMPMGGIDDMLDSVFDEGEYNSHNRNGKNNRIASGGSHGMPSPLYDSSTGRGVERIQSKDIVALMDHLTVRDAQRNARDTEILITLVRSAAEMRNSFEDMKKQLEHAQNEIINQVDVNTERSVQKVLVGPRPQPVSAPRPRRSLASEGNHEEDEAGKRKSMFKRALKGLSMKSANDLTRIEGMLERLLDEVEGLKGGNEFYQQSILGTIENLKNTPPHTALDAPSSSTANSGYYTGGPSASAHSNGPSRQASNLRGFDDMRSHTRISPIEESTSVTPMPQPQQQNPSQDPATTKFNPPAPVGITMNTPQKLNEKPTGKRESNSSSLFPKISRWSETTTSSGVRGFLRKGKPGKESEASMSNSEFDFWAESGQPGQAESPKIPEIQSPGVPPSSRGTDAPVNQATIRSSLEVKHPQPKPVYRHQLEAQAQQFINMEPAFNVSSPSLVRFTGADSNGPMSPMSDTYTASMADSQAPQRPPKILEEYEGTPSPGPLKEKKSKERNKDRSGRKSRGEKDHDEKDRDARRRERQERRAKRAEKENGGERSHRSSKSKLKDDEKYLDTDLGDQSPSTTTRSVSNVSRLKGPRPQSSHSHRGTDGTREKDYKVDLENSGTVKRHRNKSAHLTSETFGLERTVS